MLYPAVSNFRMANPHGTKFDNLVNRKSDTEDEVTDEMSSNKEQKEKWMYIYTRLLNLETLSLTVFGPKLFSVKSSLYNGFIFWQPTVCLKWAIKPLVFMLYQYS